MTTVFGEARGERGIVVGGDVIRSVLVTGDHNRVFVGDYELLRDAYIQPWSVFQRVDVEGFVGREWLTAEIDAFLATEDRGYFVLEAPAGVGKTAFLAHLVAARGYVHHFVELARGPDGVASALKSLAAQVVRAAELLPYSVEEVLPPAAGARPDFFAHLLKRFSDRRASDQDKLVIVVDSLDEAGTPIGHNVLGLPEVLPPGVYVIVSQRPVPVTLDTQTPLRVFPMAAGHELNMADMRRFLERAIEGAQFAAVVRDSDYTPVEVVDALLARSAGVWIYLHFVLADIVREGSLNLDVLPDGLWAYYARFWRRWRNGRRDEWYRTYLPLLATLAAVQEDASADLLATLAGVRGGPALASLLDEDWFPFLAVSEGDERRYRPYHASVREFLEGRLDRTGRRAMDLVLARELRNAVHDAHRQIATRYLEHWGGLAAGLPGLLVGSAPGVDGGYGLRHLTAHLAESGQHDQIDLLLRLQRGTHNVWFAVHDLTGALSAYQADLTRAWQLVKADSDRELAAGREPRVAVEARYALHSASINALASSIPRALLAGLVRARVWSPAKGLAYALQIPSQHGRSSALGVLAAETPVEFHPDLLSAVEALDHDDCRAGALAALAEHLPDSCVSRAVCALPVTASHLHENLRGTATSGLGVRLGRMGEWQEVLRLLEACPAAQPATFAALAPELPEHHLADALHLATANEDPTQRAYALSALLPRLDEDQAAAAQRAVLVTSIDIGGLDLVEVLAALPPLQIGQRGGLTRHEVLDIIEQWHSPWARARGLAVLASSISGDERTHVLNIGVASAQAVPVSPEGRVNSILYVDGPACGLFERADALGALLPLLDGGIYRKVREEAVAAARAVLTEALGDVLDRGTWTYASGSSTNHPRLTRHGVGADGPFHRRRSTYRGQPRWGQSADHRREGPWLGAAPALLAGRLPALDGAELLNSALETVRAVPGSEPRAWLLAELCYDTPERHRDEVLALTVEAVERLPESEDRCRILLKLLSNLGASARDQVVPMIIDAAPRVKPFDTRLQMLNELARAEGADVVASALPTEAEWSRELSHEATWHVDALISHLPSVALENVLRVARMVNDRRAQTEALAGLAPYLPPAQRESAIARAIAFEDIGEAEEAHDPDYYRDRHSQVVARLARHLAVNGYADDAIRVAAANPPDPYYIWSSSCHESLKEVAILLAASDPSAALRAVSRITRKDEHEQALAAVLEQAPEHLKHEAVPLARTADEKPAAITREQRRLDEPAARSDGRLTIDPLQAIDAARQADRSDRAMWITAAAGRLDANLSRQALELALSIDDEEARCRVVDVLVIRLVDLDLPEEATAAVLRLSNVQTETNEVEAWEDVLIKHVRRLIACGYLDEARDAAFKLPEYAWSSDHPRADALTELARRYAAIGAVRTGIQCALSITDTDDTRSEALAAFADAATTAPPANLLPAIRAVLDRAATLSRPSLLTDLAAIAPLIVRVGGRQVIEDIATAIGDTARWWP